MSDSNPLIEVTGHLQHAAWFERTIPPVEQLRTDLWSIPVPMPDNPLRYVSVYVLGSDTGLTLIDAGWDSDESWAALCDGLTGIGASITDVQGSLVTHQHFDHIGLAQRVREASGAWIALHPADYEAIMRPDFREPALARAADEEWWRRLGAADDDSAVVSMKSHTRDVRSTFAVPDRLVEDGEVLRLPGWTLRAVHTPGHTPGHLCFVDETLKVLFAGDHVLPRISPNISAERLPGTDALGDFLLSLSKIGVEDIDEVLPAHEWRFRGLRARTDDLAQHHERRLAELLTVVRAHPGSVPWTLAGHLTWSRAWDQYDGFMRISAVGETAAHLVHLVRRGLVVASDHPAPTYTAVPS